MTHLGPISSQVRAARRPATAVPLRGGGAR